MVREVASKTSDNAGEAWHHHRDGADRLDRGRRGSKLVAAGMNPDGLEARH